MWIFRCNLQFLALNGSFCNTVKHPRTHGEITWPLSHPLSKNVVFLLLLFMKLWTQLYNAETLSTASAVPPPTSYSCFRTHSWGLKQSRVDSENVYSCQPLLYDPCWWHFTYRHWLLSLSWPCWTLLDDTEDTCGVMGLDTHDWLHVILFQHERGWAAKSCVYWCRAGGNSKDAAL